MAVRIGMLAAAIPILSLGFFLVWRSVFASRRRARFARARRDFHWQRERLEAKFLILAQHNARPGTPSWIDCRFDDDVAYVRKRVTGELSAFVGVVIAVEDFRRGRDRAAKAVHVHRAATAVFQFNGRHWDTDGQAIFDLSPTETIQCFRRDLEVLGHEPAEHC